MNIDELRELALKCPTEYPLVGEWGDIPEVMALSKALKSAGYIKTSEACCGGKVWAQKVLHAGDVFGMHLVETEASEPHWTWNKHIDA